MWNRVSVLTKPTASPVALDEVRSRLRIDDASSDADLARMVLGAVSEIDGPNGIGYALMAQTWRLTLDAFPSVILLPGAPITGVTTISYVDTAGATQTVGSFRVDLGATPVRVTPDYNASWPATRCVTGAVTVDYTLGAAEPGDVPSDLVDCVLLMVGHRYEHREPVAFGSTATEIPMTVRSILARYAQFGIAA